MPRPNVAVLLSTYNGARFLPEFLLSLANQDFQVSTLYLRDDGSSDDSCRLVEALWSPRPILIDPSHGHAGAAESFLRLLNLTSDDVDVALFADQDDVWSPAKVRTSVDALEGQDEPTLYFSNLVITDERLAPIRIHHDRPPRPSFGNALVQNIATGNTIAMNRPAIDLLKLHMPSHAIMHDAWCYLVISGCGGVVYDPTPRVLYRQHAKNALGVQTSRVSSWQNRLLRQLRFGGRENLFAQASELLEVYGAYLRPANRALAEDFVGAHQNLGKRIRFASSQGIVRQTALDTLIAKVLYVLKRL